MRKLINKILSWLLFSPGGKWESTTTLCQSRQNAIDKYGLMDIQLDPGDQLEISPCQCAQCRSITQSIKVKTDRCDDQNRSDGSNDIAFQFMPSHQTLDVDDLCLRNPNLLTPIPMVGVFAQADREESGKQKLGNVVVEIDEVNRETQHQQRE